MPDNQFIRFSLDIGYDQFLAVYQGVAKTIVTIADDGRRIQFPAGNVRHYLTKDGIHGYFQMELTPANKFVAISRIV